MIIMLTEICIFHAIITVCFPLSQFSGTLNIKSYINFHITRFKKTKSGRGKKKEKEKRGKKTNG